MKKIFELLGKAEPKAGEYGIEIEAEGNGMRSINNKWWGTHDDGSLRGMFPDERAEFVLKEPVPKKSVKAVLKLLNKELEGAEFNFSFRTSVHVHMNVQELTYIQVLNIIYTYLLLEEPLLTYCGRSRKANRFCLRVQDAEGILETLNDMFSNGSISLFQIKENAVRYASINVAALNKYGSLEFRSMRGTVDEEVLNTWIDALHNLKTFAVKFESPIHVFEEFQKTGPEAFMKKALGKTYEKFTYARLSRDIERSYSLSFELPYAFKEFLKKEEQRAAYKDKDKIDPVNDIPFSGMYEKEATIRIRKEAVRQLKDRGRLSPDYIRWFRGNDTPFFEYLVFINKVPQEMIL